MRQNEKELNTMVKNQSLPSIDLIQQSTHHIKARHKNRINMQLWLYENQNLILITSKQTSITLKRKD